MNETVTDNNKGMSEIDPLDRWILRLVPLALILLSMLQLSVIWNTYLGPWSPRIIEVWNRPGWERAAIFQHWVRDDDRRFIAFVRERVPEAGSVIIPPPRVHFVFSDRSLMQFFLYPRSIVQCETINAGVCQELIESKAVFVLVLAETDLSNVYATGYEIDKLNSQFSLAMPK